MNLSEHSWTEAADADTRLAVLPVGSTEQHGPHAPLGTDAYLAGAVADRAADRTDAAAVVAPGLPIGVSPEHRSFAGTMWVSADAFRAFVRDAVCSLEPHGFDRVVLVNGHGGNVAALREVAADITRSREMRCVSFTWFDAIDTGDYRMGHAGPVETSALLAARPDVVDRDAIERAGEESVDRWGTWIGGTNVAVDTEEFAPNGVVGDPRTADATAGEELLTNAAERLCAVIDHVASA